MENGGHLAFNLPEEKREEGNPSDDSRHLCNPSTAAPLKHAGGEKERKIENHKFPIKGPSRVRGDQRPL